MAVFRLERTRDYTVMSNHHLRDKRLSLKAKGLLSQMLSLPEDWDYTLSGLAYINRESKDAIRSAVHELNEPVMSSATKQPIPAASSASMSTSFMSVLSLQIRHRKSRRRIIQQLDGFLEDFFPVVNIIKIKHVYGIEENL